MRFIAIFAILMSVSVAYSAAVEQTDWSGGDGVQGPVINWGDTYFSRDGIISTADGMLALGRHLVKPVEHRIADAIGMATSICLADLDGDGDLDVAGVSYDDHYVFWSENQESGTVWKMHMIEDFYYGAYYICTADIDNDGDMDLACATLDGHNISWWENKDGAGTDWRKRLVINGFGGARSVHAEDIDGDGDVDLMGAACLSNAIAWWENLDGVGVRWKEHVVEIEYSYAHSVSSADIDGDGDMDILGAAVVGDNVSWWENQDGSGINWKKHTIDPRFDYALCVSFGDFDGDGDMDVLGASYTSDTVIWWENKYGAGLLWTKHVIDSSFDGVRQISAADVDGDGNMDVLGAAGKGHEIAWWANTDGSGKNFEKHLVDDNFRGATFVCAGDMDRDGGLDIAGAAYHGDEVAWWRVSECRTDGSIVSSILDLALFPAWDSIQWTSSEHSGTSIGIQVRSSANSSEMGDWSDTLYTSGVSLAGVLSDSTQYVQYRLRFKTDSPAYSPFIEDITLSYNFLGIEEDNSLYAKLLPFSPNPVSGSLTASVLLPGRGDVEFSVYDTSGRIVRSVSQTFEAGNHSINLGELGAGVYFCRMVSGELSDVQMFAVVN